MSFHDYCLKESKKPSLEISRNISTETKSQEENTQDQWTTQRLIEELYLYLTRYDIRLDEYTGIRKSRYERQAEELIYRIPVHQPTPSFIVNIHDLNDKLKEELAALDLNSLADIMREAVGRIFENFNERYFKLRVLHTTDESRIYSGKRIIGINGINLPVSNSDALNRTFVIEMEKVPDGSDGITESKLVPENEFIDNFRKLMPEILTYIFDVLVNALQIYDQVKKGVKSNHRLADFVVWGETISRALGNNSGEFLKAWQQNTDTQRLTVVRNNSLAALVISYAFNERPETEFDIEPQHLLIALKEHAPTVGINYDRDKYLPTNHSWLSRQINMICEDLRIAGLVVIPNVQKGHKRYIKIKKDIVEKCPDNDNKQNVLDKNNQLGQQHPQKNEQQGQQEQLPDDSDKRSFAIEIFKQRFGEKVKGKIQQYDFQMELVSTGKFYQDTAFAMIENLIKDGALIKEGLELRLIESTTGNNNNSLS
jgi:hypothetical protein